MVTVKLWCCVCVFVASKREFSDGMSVTQPDRTGQDRTRLDRTGHDRTGQEMSRQDATDRDRQETKGTVREVVVTVMLWCCVCVFVTPKHELCDVT